MSELSDNTRHYGAIQALFSTVTLIVISALFAACGFGADFSDIHEIDGPDGKKRNATGTISVSISPGNARTVVPDAILEAKSFAVDYTNHTNPALSGRATALTGSTLTVADVYPGSLSLTVYAYSSASVQDTSTQIASGTSEFFTLAGGDEKNVSVILSMKQNPSVTTGSFSLDLSWPVSTGANFLTARLVRADDTFVADMTPIITAGTTFSATVRPPDEIALASGQYRLTLSFHENDASGVSKGTFVETVNVYDGLTSTHWIDPSGNLVSIRTFSESEFNSGNTSIRITTQLGTETPTQFDFTPTGDRDANLGDIADWYVWVRPDSDIPGQGIAAQLNGEAPTQLVPGHLTRIRLSGGENELVLTVTAPDMVSRTTYTIFARIPQTEISTAAQLAAITMYGSYIITAATIDISGYANWPSLDTFSGELDGNGSTITGLRASSPNQRLGFFLTNNGIIKNLTIAGATITSSRTGYEARCGILCGENIGTIYHCAVSGSVTNSVGGGRIGGLVGINFMGSLVQECYSVATINAASSNFVACLVGTNQGRITDSYVRGTVLGTDAVGGIAGQHEREKSTVTRCYSTGVITGVTNVGGCAGNTFIEPLNDINPPTVIESYYRDGSVTISGTSPHGEAKTMGDMKNSAMYPSSWDFDTVWGIDPLINDGYPFLRYFNELVPSVILTP